MSDAVRVFINEVPVDATRGSTVAAALTAHDRTLADQLSHGGYLTDGVGRRIAPDATVAPGLIVRVVTSSNQAPSEE